MKNKFRIVVTGAAGFIGSHTVDRLLEVGCDVVGIDDLSAGSVENLESALQFDDFDFILGDVTDESVVNELFSSFAPDAVIHLAGLVSAVRAEEDPVLNYRLNYQTTQVVADAACRNNTKRLVFASTGAMSSQSSKGSGAVERDCPPVGLYAKAKFLSEKLLIDRGKSNAVDTVCLRYFNVYGPRQEPHSPYADVASIFAYRMARGLPVTIFGDGSQTRDFISVFDVARANVLAATGSISKSVTCDICTGKAHSLQELWDEFGRFFPDASQPEYTSPIKGEVFHSCGDPSSAKTELGFVAEKNLEEGLEMFLEALGIQISSQKSFSTQVA